MSYGIECSFLVIITHSIPHDTVTHWNEVINPYLHRQFTSCFSTFFPTRETMTVKMKVFSQRGFPTTYSLVPGVEHAENIVPRHSEKDSSKQIRFLCDYNFVGWCNFIINLYKQQQNIDSPSSKGWYIIISHQALLCLFLQTRQWARACLLHKLAITTLFVVVPLADFYYDVDLWMKCSKFERQRAGWEQGAGRVRCSYQSR